MIVRNSAGFAKRRMIVLALIFLGLSLSAVPAMSNDHIDADANHVLQAMARYLGELPAFSVSANIDNEVITLAGQKVQLSSSGTLVAKRPNQFYASRKGGRADVEFLFDGHTVTLHGKGLNVYTQITGPQTIDDAITSIRMDLDLEIPGADLFYSDAYTELTAGVVSGFHLGNAYINGIECHHLAFRKDQLDWQLWVQTGDKPLPMKYVITTKWLTGAPQYSIQFRDWNTSPIIQADQFTFVAAEGAKNLETLLVDEAGDLMTEGRQ